MRLAATVPLGSFALAGKSSIAVAHVAGTTSSSDLLGLLMVSVLLVLSAALYALGFLRLRARGARRGREANLRAGAFAAGLLATGIALLSPLDRWASELFALHMIQHEMLMLCAAPLLVLGRPLPLLLWAFNEGWRAGIARFVQRPTIHGTWRVMLSAGVAWLLHALALWVWHVPRFFDAAVLNRSIHELQHFTFLVTALVFWAALLEERRSDQQGAGILYLFTTTVHTSVLGALITFASRPWYSAYLQTPNHSGLSALEDQQLGGLIMWVPGALVYVGIALVLLARWIRSAEGWSARTN